MCNSFKQELLQSGHCFNATVTPTGTNTSGQFTWTSMSAVTGLAVGMAVTGTNVAAGSVIASIDSTTQITLSKASTGGPNSGITLTCTADAFKMLLIKVAPTNSYSNTQTNVGTPGTGAPSLSNIGTDEVTGTNYTPGGFALGNVTPTVPGSNTAITTFSANPSWSSATFSAIAAIIYNTSTHQGAASTPFNNRAVSVHDFGGTQTVTSGTFTVVLPTADAANAILRIN